MIKPEGLALLVVDVQPAFLGALASPDAFVRRCRLAVSAARQLGVPVLFTEQAPGKLGATHPDLLLDAGPGAGGLAKTAFSAFGAEGLEDRLSGLEAGHLLVIGLEGPVCVHQTVLDGLRRGMGVTVLCDAVTARRPEDQAASLRALSAAGASVLPVETVFYSLLGGSEHPAFRAFTELVKRHA
jgi:nicotinamidase-related amidase